MNRDDETRVERAERLWRKAMQLIGQLPDDHDDALTVIGYMREHEVWAHRRLMEVLKPHQLREDRRRLGGTDGVVVEIKASDNRPARSTVRPLSLPK